MTTPNFGINALTPPQNMQTLVYAPAVRILIAHGSAQYDVSKDVVRGQVIRKENSASTLFFMLANKDLRYNGMFERMDRVTVFLKRITWQQVFSGYLDNVPYQHLYQGMAQFKATCTLKRLMFTQWNPSLPQSQAIFNQFTPGTLVAGDGQTPFDSGLGSLLQALLMKVGGWNRSDVHIQNFPITFLTFLQSQVESQSSANQAQVNAFKNLMGVGNTSGPPQQYAGYSSAAGDPGPPGIGSPFYVQQIVAACDERGLGPTTVDLTLSSNLAQGGTEGLASRDAATRQMAQNAQQTQVNYNTFVQHNDAAIIGVATAAVETGGGVTIRNLYNPAVPDSANFLPNDGPGFDGTSCGIFQQINGANWGTVSQRMNPKQAAGMFFDRLATVDWRNSDPGMAAWTVQRASDPTGYAAKVDAAIPWATQQVQAIRAPQNAAASTVAANPVSSAVSSVAGAAGLPSSVIGPAANSPVSVNPGSLSPGGLGVPSIGGSAAATISTGGADLGVKPNPDSEGAVQTAMAQIGKPYVWGATGPNSFDCSGLMVYAYRSIGIALPRTTQAMASSLPLVPPSNIRRGDLIVSPARDHVVMWLGGGQIIESGGQAGAGVHVNTLYWDLNACAICQVAQNGGPNPASPRTDPMLAGPGLPPGSGATGVGGTNNEPIATNLFYYEFVPGSFADEIAPLLAAEPFKEYIDCQPLMSMVNRVCRGSLRNFASGPDGSFIAYYPDYFGIDGKPAVVSLEDIELKDVHLDLSDDQLTTHVYVNGYPAPVVSNWDPLLGWLDTAGVATIEQTWLFERLTKILPTLDIGQMTAAQIEARFGVRPFTDTSMLAGSHELEFLLACQIFMEKWAQQFQTAVQFTFLPELFPGMRVVLKNHNLQVYVSEVTHTFDYEHGFTTDAVIMAPSVPGALNRMANTGTGLLNPDQTNIMAGLGGFDNAGTSSTVTMGGQ